MPVTSAYCSECGSSQFVDGQDDKNAISAKANDVYISNARIILASISSLGLYFPYWLYLTWKHLARETEEVHYPAWHALSFFIPVYGLSRLHKHFSVINTLALTKGMDPLLTPKLAVVQTGLVWMLSFALLQTSLSSIAVILMNLIGLALTTVVPYLGQGTLNRYWATIHGDNLQSTKFNFFEIAIIGFGIYNWVGLLRAP